ncbi:acetolactate decarboxylase [Aerococcaceae bacterium 50-4]
MGKLFQHQTLGDLMAGFFDGSMTIEALLKEGNYGIGTMDHLDGELIVIDGKAYQAKESGELVVLKGDETVPYAAVTDFIPDQTFTVNELLTLDEWHQYLKGQLQSLSTFSVIRIEGTFDFMHTRVIPRVEKPYPRFVEVSRQQPEFKQENAKGTCIGIYGPYLFEGVVKQGFHCHFISEDRTFGGHIMDYTINHAEVSIQTVTDFHQHFATNDSAFMNATVNYDNLISEMNESE